MAGDWIKMRGNLWDDPRVARLCDLTEQNEVSVIGSLYWLWNTADQHSENGCLPAMTARTIDRKTNIPGIGKALIDVGWIVEDERGITVVRFKEHNGASAKRRAMDAKRKGSVRKKSARDADNLQTERGGSGELEKELEKEKDLKDYSPNGESASPGGDTPAGGPIDLAGSPGADKAPHKQIVDLYHRICPGLRSVIKLTPSRQQAIRARWRNDLKTLDEWETYFTAVAESDFLSGRAKPRPGSDQPFQADFDWLIKQANCVKIMEGRYD